MTRARHVFEVARRERWSASGWLMLGKGPSFSSAMQLEFLHQRILCLNHTVAALWTLKRGAYQPGRTVVHAVDLEVVADCAEAILAGARYLLMPWLPNRAFRRGERTLDELSADNVVLRRLAGENRLLWYNRAGSRTERPGSPAIEIQYFSAEGALGVLAHAGVKVVTTAGIDGGRTYAREFAHLAPLQNGRPTFDDQLGPLRHLVRSFEMHFAPLAEVNAGRPVNLDGRTERNFPASHHMFTF
jgi:hypothetical protein